MGNHAENYRYDPFPDDLVDLAPFRLLYLHAGALDDLLVGSLKYASLNTATTQVPDYEALSYCCGDASKVATISINSEGQLPLGRNLSRALLELRLPSVTRTLWIDAICINQNDLDERAREVLLMHRIYQRARKVLIWLDGPNLPQPVRHWDPGLAFDMATKLHKLRSSDPDIDIRGVRRVRKTIARIRAGLAGPVSRVRDGSYQQSSDALRLIFSCPWFERMWVVQEVTVATTAIVHCGQHTIDYVVLLSGFDFGLRSGLFAAQRKRTIVLPRQVGAANDNASAAMAMYLLNANSSSEGDLLNLLTRFHGSKSTDPRDKLYALYGISSLERMDTLNRSFRAIGIRPDYRADVTQLYVNVARGILRFSKHLDLLSVPRAAVRSIGLCDLPSWVPDWSTADPNAPPRSFAGSGRYSASGKSTFVFEDRDCDAHGMAIGSTLVLSGFIFDHVTEIGVRSIKSDLAAFNAPQKVGEPVRIVAMFLIWIDQMISWEFSGGKLLRSGQYVNGQDMIDVYWALLMAARNEFESQWYLSDYPAYDMWPTWWSRWCSRQLDRMPKPHHSRYRDIYLGLVTLSFYARGLRRFGIHDDAIARSRTILTTTQGYLGLGPAATKPGDLIMLFCGGKTPLVVRPSYETAGIKMTLVGDAYIHGIMTGEAWDEARCQSFVLS